MRVPGGLVVAWVLVAAAVAVPPARAQHEGAALTKGGQVQVEADEISYDQRANTIVARGHVVVRRGTTQLRADEIRINRATNDADATGHVEITDPAGTILASEAHLNLDSETGVLEDAAIRSAQYRYSLWGARVEKGLGQSYHIENGRFTTCNCAQGAPSWSISGKRLDVDVGGYGHLQGGTVNVLDTPVLYVPRAIFPAQRERQSGFLLPRFGFSNLRGFQTLLPFYWAISKSQDATVAVDAETNARVGAVGEYRYAFSRETQGTVNASYFNEFNRGAVPGQAFEPTVPEDRWSLDVQHVQAVGPGATAYADTLLLSDPLFLRDINTYAFDHAADVAIRTMPFTASRVGVVQLWDRVGLKGEGTYYQNLEGTQSQTLQRAPQLDLWGQKLFGTQLLGDVEASGVDFQRGSAADGFRLDVQPSVMLPLPLGHAAFGALHVAGRETAYRLISDELAGSNREVAQSQTRELLEAGGEVGTVLDRVYTIQRFGIEKLKHTIEPQLSYLYVPAVDQGDLPIFDGVDRVNQRNLVTYGVTSRFIGKFAGPSEDGAAAADASGGTSSVREIGRLSLMQSADITRSIASLQTNRASDHFSDVDFAGRVNPSRFLSMRFLTNYDTGNNVVSAARVGLFVEDPRDQPAPTAGPRLETRTSAGISYRFLTQNLLQELDDNIVLHLTDWAGLLYSSRYDVVANRFLDNFFGLRLISTCDCWAVDLALTDRTNPHEVEFRAQLTLAGFGSGRQGSRVAAAP